jgi:hypothetical protein
MTNGMVFEAALGISLPILSTSFSTELKNQPSKSKGVESINSLLEKRVSNFAVF